MKVFLSYSRRDKDIARDVRAALEECGHEVWQDETSIPGGAHWREEIEKGIHNTDAFVILLSPAITRAPKYPREELDLARHHDRLIVPVRLRPMKELPDGFTLTLSGIERIDLFPSLKHGVEKIVQVLGPLEKAAADEGEPSLRAVGRHGFAKLKKHAHQLRMEAKQRELGKRALKVGGAVAAAGVALAAAAAAGQAGEQQRTAERDERDATKARASYKERVDEVFGACGREFGRGVEMNPQQYKEQFRPNVRYLLGQLTGIEPPTNALVIAHRRLVHSLEETLTRFDAAVAKIEMGEEQGAKHELERMVERFFEMLQDYARLLEEES